jgi:CheY-like chemotaxis protein
MMLSAKPILLVEDDDVDAMTTQRALKDINVTNELVHKVNGEEAMEYLREDGNELPFLILLDLNMPKMNGFEFLNVIKGDSVLKRIPVVVLTTSETEQNIMDSYELGAAGYFVKPVDYKHFVEVMKTIQMYWTLNRFPNNERLSVSADTL